MRWLSVLALLLVAGCESVPPPVTDGTTASGVVVKTDKTSEGLTIEQQNIRDRLVADNKPGSIKHLYVISPCSGQVLIYSTVRGKVTSSSKRLEPSTIAGAGDARYIDGYSMPGTRMITHEVLGDDGTYGNSGDYLYWWDAKGVYHQHYLTGGQIVHVSDQPLAVHGIIINMELEK
jgi:uncharacterized protein YcfL